MLDVGINLGLQQQQQQQQQEAERRCFFVLSALKG